MTTARKIIIVFAVVVFSTNLTFAQKQYGKELTLKETTKVSAILAEPEKFNGKRVLVEGTIVDVCKNRGCWIRLASDKEFESIQFKVEDGVIIFPLEVKGKDARAEGIVSVTTYSVEQLIEQGMKHAKEEGKEFDPATVTGPKTVIRIDGLGARIK